MIFDIYGDYLLTRHWSRFDDRPLSFVIEGAYAALRAQAQYLPDSLAERFARMSAGDWLHRYGTYEGQAYVFERFGRRLSRPELLAGVIDTLRAHEARFVASFSEFYPWMQASCARWLATTPRSED